MGDYNLHGLNPRDFQHLVQAIARKQIAAGVTAFGDGKDGARDLTYRGKMDYPSSTSPWDGYLVVGCKFNQRPSGDSKKDGDWALKQLENDLKKFVNRKRKLSKPEYYLFVTNVALTGVVKKGSRDRATALFKEYTPKLRLKDYGVWDYNDIRGFLDGDRDLCASYGHFVTTGDVLNKMMKLLKLQSPDFADVMHTFLQKELIADMSAKLQSAEDPDAQIPLANVFVDLPFAESAEAATLAKADEDNKSLKVIGILLKAGSFVFRRTSEDEDDLVNTEGGSLTRKVSRFVIVGGPGQGKSTLGQYLCQLYRASILKDRPARRLDEHVPGILKQLEKQRDELGGLPLARRFPLRIELRMFSHELMNDPELTLLEYIRRDIARLGSATVMIEDLKAWLEQYPWLLVLDGLDEVPPSSNRNDVIKQIEHFRVDAASLNSDLMIVATTRPQSYSKEFRENLFQHLYLMPLAPKQALHYGRKLAEARCGADERRRDELFSSLEKACKNDATARLMQSPLQVTIMATLLEETGEPPQQRYRLFAEYYRTIYRRETRRKLLEGILSERQKDIDTIHTQAGLLLHAAGEKAAKRSSKTEPNEPDSALSDEQFRELVRRRLKHIEVPPGKAAELLSRIADGSLLRLVFLVRSQEGWVRFDITSLKEFMAAESLMIGGDDDVRQRLATIASASYWRNVFMFAVGKCFAEREHMLDKVVSLCTGLNEEISATELLGDELAGRAAKSALWGSRLALDILVDGTAHQYPGYEIRLARIALDLVKTGDQESHARLAYVYHDDLYEMYNEVIDDRLGQLNFRSQIGAWNLLMSMADREVEWASKLMNKRWPENVDHQRRLLLSRERTALRKWWIEKLFELAPKISPTWLTRYSPEGLQRVDSKYIIEQWRKILEFTGGGLRSLKIPNRSSWNDLIAEFNLVSVHIGSEWSNAMRTVNFDDSNWFPYIAASRFGENPSAKSLAQELRWLSKNWEPDPRTWLNLMPWPLSACLRNAKSKRELADMANLVESGKLGDSKEWQAAEERWIKVGVGDSDFLVMSDERWPFDVGFAQSGFPFASGRYMLNASKNRSQISTWIKRLRGIPGERMRAWLANFILDMFNHFFITEQMDIVSPRDYRELCILADCLREQRWRHYWLDSLHQIHPENRLDTEWIDFLEWLGRQDYRFNLRAGSFPCADQLVHHFCSNPEGRRGLLSVIAKGAELGSKCVLSRDVLTIARSWGGRARDEAIALTLARDDISSNEIIDLANEIQGSTSLNYAVQRALRIASNTSSKQAVTFALALLEVLSGDSEIQVQAVDRARQFLVEYLTTMPSNLDAPGVWERLRLPERL